LGGEDGSGDEDIGAVSSSGDEVMWTVGGSSGDEVMWTVGGSSGDEVMWTVGGSSGGEGPDSRRIPNIQGLS
jgi:hypothetical protein